MKIERLPASAIELIEGTGIHAHLVTMNADGSPQVSIVWSAVDDGEICIASLVARRNVRNVRRNPRVAISYFSPKKDEENRLHHYLVVKGTARVTESGAPEFLMRMAPRFIAPGVKYPRNDNPPEGFITRVRPEVIEGNGPWIDSGTTSDFYARLKLPKATDSPQ